MTHVLLSDSIMYIGGADKLKKHTMTEFLRSPKEVLKSLNEHKKVELISNSKVVAILVKPKE